MRGGKRRGRALVEGAGEAWGGIAETVMGWIERGLLGDTLL